MKGMMHTLEAVLGSVLVLVGIMMIFPVQQVSEINFSEVGYSCLNYLDQNGLLRYYAINNMNTELNDSLRLCLPPTSNFKFRVCSVTDCIDDNIPYDKAVYLSSYLIAGENYYNKKIINLWVWSR